MWLKIIACVLMFFDHYAHLFQSTLSPDLYLLIRLVGRLSFPAFAYLIVVGMKRTRDIRRYLLRLFLMALFTQTLFKITELVFQLSLWTNVLFTFSFALIGLIGIELLLYGMPDMSVILQPVSAQGPGGADPGEYNQRVNLHGLTVPRKVAVWLGLLLILLCFALTLMIEPDYDIYGIITVMIFYFTDPNGRSQRDDDNAVETSGQPHTYLPMFLVFLVYNLIMSLNNLMANASLTYSFLQAFSVFSVPLFALAFSGKRPNAFGKYFFYFFYPLHIVVLAILSRLLI